MVAERQNGKAKCPRPLFLLPQPNQLLLASIKRQPTLAGALAELKRQEAGSQLKPDETISNQ
jgi:hypothetical protein